MPTIPFLASQDYAAGVAVLRAADMTNRKTWDANHNGTPLAKLLEEFRAERARLVARLEALNHTQLAASALHPRLKTPMRVVDLVFFIAEHDDYHSARADELLREFRGGVA